MCKNVPEEKQQHYYSMKCSTDLNLGERLEKNILGANDQTIPDILGIPKISGVMTSKL